MIVREATAEDKDVWNQVASKSPYSTYAHTWEWKEILEKSLGLETISLVAETDSKIVGIYSGFVSPVKKKKVLFSPYNYTWDYGAPCVLPGHENCLSELMSQMEKYAKKHNAISLRISPFQYPELEDLLENNEYRKSERLTYLIDLTPEEEQLWGNVKKNARRYINKPKEAGIKIIRDDSIEGMKRLFEILKDFSDEKDIFSPPWKFYEMVHENFVKHGMAFVHLVEYEGKVIGGSFAYLFNDIVTFRYAAIIDGYKDLSPHYLLHWHRVLEFKKTGAKLVDLGGMPSDEKSGVYFFKSRFGGEVVHVDWFVKDVYLKTLREIKRKIKS